MDSKAQDHKCLRLIRMSEKNTRLHHAQETLKDNREIYEDILLHAVSGSTFGILPAYSYIKVILNITVSEALHICRVCGVVPDTALAHLNQVDKDMLLTIVRKELTRND